ncbi:MAG: hypothetical protein KDC88_07240 [Ignavibacteriae bacterium]|nr:hypothetical protein [Ignavibacteriota bacterium]MCB9208454.1 hypothetical protein [Ignavibacteriales bacterium]MCB9258438.1 hypothetical protein [Ignavibacteriales bacterium]
MEYNQISCSLFDRLESLAVSSRIIEIKYLTSEEKEDKVKGFIKNIFSENKAEFLLINGIKIRLDKILSITEF